jgi:hypothetical protein
MRLQDERIASCVMVKASEKQPKCLPTMLVEPTIPAKSATNLRRNRLFNGQEARNNKRH